ncbi:MAG: hypothetical protein ABIH72_02130 [archaeon]
MAKKGGSELGKWAFLVGVILAVILPLFGPLSQGMLIALVIIGIVVGLLNIADEEAMPFLLSGVALVIVASMGSGVLSIVSLFDKILNALLVIFVPATVIVAIKNVFSLAKR